MENFIKPQVKNEWGQLREIILGIPNNAQVPTMGDKSLHCIDYAHLSDEQFKNRPSGVYPPNVIQETEEDLNEIHHILNSLGVKVYRPNEIDFSDHYMTDNWEVDGYYNYCPRDTVLIINDKAIEVPMAIRHRQIEAERTLKPLFKPENWVQAPRPKLLDTIYQREDLSRPTLCNGEPVFDAANVIKHNNDLLYLVSNTGNLDGAKWLESYCKETFGNEYNVHLAQDVYAYIHIDTTFVFLREGLVLLNPARVNWRNLPEFLSRFDRVWAPEPFPTQVMEDWCPASPWLGMNILPINDKLCMVEEHQTLLMKTLKKWGIESIPIKLRHARTLSGGPHCVTLDVVRDD
jgi:glycine amidinotransferase/scyllo-inosamine-4-phosphate amidinotransferase 1